MNWICKTKRINWKCVFRIMICEQVNKIPLTIIFCFVYDLVFEPFSCSKFIFSILFFFSLPFFLSFFSFASNEIIGFVRWHQKITAKKCHCIQITGMIVIAGKFLSVIDIAIIQKWDVRERDNKSHTHTHTNNNYILSLHFAKQPTKTQNYRV